MLFRPMAETGRIHCSQIWRRLGIQMETGSDVQVTWQKCEDIMKKRIPEAILAKPEDFDKVWDAFLADLDKAGVKKMNEQWTQLIKDRVKLWNE